MTVQTRIFTKPAICITFPRSEIHAEHSADVVAHTAGCSSDAETRIISAVETAYPQVECYIRHGNNLPVVTMSRTARRLCGDASDTDIARTAGIYI